ncbi:MAG: hypothetical protein ACK4NY_15955 [Spirosomataceae bacterium]
MKDTSGRNTKKFFFNDGDSSNIKSTIEIYEYYSDSKKVKSVSRYDFLQVNEGIYFDNKFDKVIGFKLLNEDDPNKTLLKGKLLHIILDKKYINRVIPSDSLWLIPIKYEKPDILQLRQDFIHHQNEKGQDIKYVQRVNGQKKQEYTYIYDDKGRNIQTIATFPQIGENSIESTRFDDEKLTSETIIQTYRKKKLYKKEKIERYYDKNNNVIKEDHFRYDLAMDELIKTQTKSNIYENGLLIKILDKNEENNQLTTTVLKYKFW